MTPEQFTAALASIGWSKRQLVERIRCDTNAPTAWARGTAKVPPMVAAWLMKLSSFHMKHPAPEQWRER